MIDTLKKLLAMARMRGIKPTTIQLDPTSYGELVVELVAEMPALGRLVKDVSDLQLEGVPVFVDRARPSNSLYIEIED